MLYLRKIKTEAWQGKNPRDSDSISDLATNNHELSVWAVHDPQKILEIGLAFAMTQDRISDFVAVLLDPVEIEKATGLKIEIRNNPGETLFKAKRNCHKDFILENVDHMILLAKYIHGIIAKEDENLIKPFNSIDLKDEFHKKINDKEIKEEDFEEEKNRGGKWGKEAREYIRSKKD